MWGCGGDSAVQPHSMGGFRGGERRDTHTHTQEHTQERTRECCFSDLPLKKCLIGGRICHGHPVKYPGARPGPTTFSPMVRAQEHRVFCADVLDQKEWTSLRWAKSLDVLLSRLEPLANVIAVIRITSIRWWSYLPH